MRRGIKSFVISLIFQFTLFYLPLWGNADAPAEKDGWLNRTIEIQLSYNMLNRNTTLTPFKKEGLWGIKRDSLGFDRRDYVVRPPEFDKVTRVSIALMLEGIKYTPMGLTLDTNLFITEKNGLFGVLLESKTVLENRYASIEAVGSGHFIFKTEGGKYGLFYYDRILLPPVYEEILYFKPYLFEVRLSETKKGMVRNILPKFRKKNTKDIISSEFKELLEPRFREILQVNACLLAEDIKGRQSVTDFSGKKIIANKYKRITPYDQNLFKVQTAADRFGLINNSGKILLPPNYDKFERRKDIYTAQKKEEDRLIYHLYKDGNPLINGDFTEFREVRSGYFLVKEKEGGRGIATEKGWLIPPDYKSVSFTGDGRVHTIEADNRWAVEIYGKIIYPFSKNKPLNLSEDTSIIFPHLILSTMNLTNFFFFFIPLSALFCCHIILVMWIFHELKNLRKSISITEKKGRAFLFIKKVYPLSRRSLYITLLPFFLLLWGLLTEWIGIDTSSMLTLFLSIGVFLFLHVADRPRIAKFMGASLNYTKKIKGFEGHLFFTDKIHYNTTGAGTLFLVQKPDKRWYVIDRQVNICTNESVREGFDRFIEKTPEGVFVLTRDGNQEFYLYIKGKIPRVNKKLKPGGLQR